MNTPPNTAGPVPVKLVPLGEALIRLAPELGNYFTRLELSERMESFLGQLMAEAAGRERLTLNPEKP